MITPQNRVIIVDDDQEKLDRLSKAFLKTGIGCRTFIYDKTDEFKFTDVRIAFFDINLGEKNINTSNYNLKELEKEAAPIYNDLAYALNQYISKDNGPYALVFWTKNKPLIDGFKNYINNPRRGYAGTAKPILIECFDKYELYSTENVQPKLNELFANDKIKFYFEIEENSRISGSKTIDNLHSIIPKDNKWGENYKYFENIDKVLSKIAISILGYDYAKEKPIKGVYEGLSQLILKEFLDSEKNISPNYLMSSLINSKEKIEIKSPDEIIANKLNTFFHIDETTEFTSEERGGVFGIKVDRLKSGDFKPSFHFSLSGYYKDLEKFNSELFFRLSSNISESNRQKIKSNMEFIAVEISASCDYSQRKMRNNKFVLGLLTPSITSESIASKSISNSVLHKEIPDFYYKEQAYSIYLNLNFVFSDSELEFIGEPKFILKKEIIDMIGNRYANHVSRIGISSF